MNKDMTPDEVSRKVLEAVDNTASNPDVINLSTGVKLRGKQANPLALITVMGNFPRPHPPTYFNKSMGREMENPDDPEYIARIKSVDMERSSATLNVMILMGTELISVPEGFSTPDSQEWMDDFQLLGLQMQPENKRWRYLRWVMFVAAPAQSDIEEIQRVVGRLSGVREEDVKDAETFSGRH